MDQALRDLRKLDKRRGGDSVHVARRRFKEIRAILRLVRGKLGEKIYWRESRLLQRAGRPLSALRDATILIESLDAMIRLSRRSLKASRLKPLRRSLLRREKRTRARLFRRKHRVSDMILLVESAGQAADLSSRGRCAWGVLTRGLMRVYVGGGVAMRRALSTRSNVALHDWRKQVTALRYAFEALQCIRPEKIAMMAKKARTLSTLLGDDHDLAVLRYVARRETKAHGSTDASTLFDVIDRRRADLQERAFKIGGEVFLETRTQILGRLNAYWKQGGWRMASQRTLMIGPASDW
jgi:CHAD domain-containing protein